MPGFGNESIQRHGAGVFTGAQAQGDLIAFHFLVADHQHVRNLLLLSVANLGVHALAAVVQIGADALGFELGDNVFGVIEVAVGDGNSNHLDRRQPNRKAPP